MLHSAKHLRFSEVIAKTVTALVFQAREAILCVKSISKIAGAASCRSVLLSTAILGIIRPPANAMHWVARSELPAKSVKTRLTRPSLEAQDVPPALPYCSRRRLAVSIMSNSHVVPCSAHRTMSIPD